jgi:hypothetical protein
MDQGKATSAAGYLLAANERLKQWYAKAADNPIGASLGMKPGNKTLVACTGVNDYTPSYAIKVHRCDPPTIANSWNPQEGKESGNSAVQFQTLAYSRNCGMRITGYTAARVGAKDRLAIDVSLNEAEVIDDGIGTGVLELSAPLGAEIRSEAGAADVPPDKQCQVKTADIPKAEARLSYMKAMKNRKRADTEYTAFAQIIDQINLERGRIAFAAQAIIACQTSRDSLVELKERYS